MKLLKKLQADYKAGKITKEEYLTQLQELFDDGDIAKKDLEAAKEYDPENDDEDKPVYTQADVDGMIVKKANQLLRKALKDAGVEVEASNKDLIGKVAELAKAGTGKETNPTELEKEVATLRNQVKKSESLLDANKKLTVENAVLKQAAKLNPVNPAQVVRALNADYADLLEFDDETGELEAASVKRALKALAKEEPNLFSTPDGGGEGSGQGNNQGSGFQGKGPGGSAGGGTNQGGEAEKLKAEALEMLGLAKKA